MQPQTRAIWDEVIQIEQAIAVGGFPMPADITFNKDLTSIKEALNQFDIHLTNYLATQDVNVSVVAAPNTTAVVVK